MMSLLAMLLLTQVASGTINGQLRDTSGLPAVGTRIGVMSVDPGVTGAALSNITITDKEGRYRLEQVLPGRYLIVAGAITSPSYFPGVTAREQGKPVTVAAGQSLAGMDFMLAPASAPDCSLSDGGVIVDDMSILRTVEQLADASSFIIDAVVQSVAPSYSPFSSDAEVLLLVRSVLKGADIPPQFTLSYTQELAKPQMKPGQRFILFLDENRRAFSSGRFCVENGRIRLGKSPLAARHDDASAEKMLDDIRTYLALPRIRGLISVEGGVFPPSGSDFAAFRVAARSEVARTDDPPLAMAVGFITLLKGMKAPTGSRIGAIDQTGRFTLALEPGSYRVHIEGLPGSFEVRSITYGSVDLMKERMRIGSALSELRILLVKTGN
jgi:hypothetical protein